MKNILIIVGIAVVLGGGVYWYLTREDGADGGGGKDGEAGEVKGEKGEGGEVLDEEARERLEAVKRQLQEARMNMDRSPKPPTAAQLQEAKDEIESLKEQLLEEQDPAEKDKIQKKIDLITKVVEEHDR